MIKKAVERFLDYSLRFKSFQDYVNTRFDLNEFIQIDGNYYSLNHSILSVEDVQKCYEFDDIRQTDIVLDIGANIGGFSIPVSKKAKIVYAIEPIFYSQLENNIAKNDIDNIIVLKYGLGEGTVKVRYNEKTACFECLSLSEMIKLSGGHVDFLKLDCEGYEWYIKPHELKGIRRIEAEIHNLDGKHDFNVFLKMLSDSGFEYTWKSINNTCIIVHAYRNNGGT